MFLFKPLLAFRPSKLDLIFATKTFIAAMLALYIAFALDLAYPMWAMGTVFVIANPYVGMTSSKSIYRLLGTIVGAIFAVAVTPSLINTPLLFTLVLAAWVSICLYISLLDRTPRSYVFMLAGYTAVLICFNAIAYIDTVSIFDMALGRCLEIALGVVCSAVVSATIFPMHVGPILQHRVNKTMQDTKALFDRILSDERHHDNYTTLLAHITRDTSDIHAMAVHLSYEQSKFKGITKPIQELLHQVTMLVANLVAISERLKQLDQIDLSYRQNLKKLHDHVIEFLKDDQRIQEDELDQLPVSFDTDFDWILQQAHLDQRVMLSSVKMDVRHFIQNVRAVKLIWQRIQHGDYSLPESIAALTTNYPSLHRDYGIAVRGAISVFMTILIATALWILSGWKVGFMMAQLAVICACILTALDNPVPALKVFVRGSIYGTFIIFIYAYGIFPHVTTFWQLVVVLAPFLIYFLSMFPHPQLVGLGLPLVMVTVMGLNLHNHYSLDQVMFFDSSIGSILGPIIAIFVIHLVRAMSPDMTAQRMLSAHYRDMQQAIYMDYGLAFRIHLRGMLDRIGLLNTKQVQSDELKSEINKALIESSAMIDLSRLHELVAKLPSESDIVTLIEQLQQQLVQWLDSKSKRMPETNQLKIIRLQLHQVDRAAQNIQDQDIRQRIQISVNNIRNSICHDGGINAEDIAIARVGV
ncbi:FUSC family protein [Acinetobacter silvestris]|uniref:Fusaric acid resistance protein n=1 Tax=Acinetobacter silvestris TaxID=1977882 RepID=A0A1Y3CL54_9GAMM|nr:FUSC family protein [Acinetobacter silvestris]OTG67178.1 fusaric acid resistance protein [Acinetobacter silvestris]